MEETLLNKKEKELPKRPRVSVLLGVYNGEKTIRRAIDSVLAQTLSSLELLVVNDASTDHTADIVRSYRDPRVRFFEMSQNSGGPALPRYVAYKESKGDFIAFIDHDDLYLPENLAKKVAYLDAHPNIDVVESYTWVVDLNRKKMINCRIMAPLTWVVRRQVVAQGDSFKQDQNGVDELGMMFRYIIASKGRSRMAKLDESLTLYCRHGGNISDVSHVGEDSFIKRLTNLLRDVEGVPLLEQDEAVIRSRIGNFYCRKGEMQKGRDMFLHSLRLRWSAFSFVLLSFSFLGWSIYSTIENFLRKIQQAIFWKIRLLQWSRRLPDSFKEAVEFLARM